MGTLCAYTNVCVCDFALEVSVGVSLCQLVPEHTGVSVAA